MQPFCISVDWLQTYNHAEPINEGVYTARGYTFNVKLRHTETAQFRRVLAVFLLDMQVATIQQQPRTSVINPKTTLIKLENRVLYSQQYVAILYALNEAMKIHYKGITRLDLCYDCNALHDGRNVARFIRQYVTAEPMTPTHIIRNGSCRFDVHGTRKNTSIASMTSISWGSPKSKIRAYCYNKTLELAEVKDKPWIRQTWEQNGITYDIDYTTLRKMPKHRIDEKTENEGLQELVKKDVWRFEISIGSQGKDILNMETGQLFQLSPRYLEHYENVRKLFYIYAAKVFDFRINDGAKRIRDYKKLQLFEETPAITCKPYYISRSADTGRMEKICYNKLEKLSQQYTDLAEYRRAALQTAMDFLKELTGKKSATVRLEHYKGYLNSLLGQRFIAEDDYRYLAAIEAVRIARKNLDAEQLYDTFYQTPAEEMPPELAKLVADITPPNFIW